MIKIHRLNKSARRLITNYKKSKLPYVEWYVYGKKVPLYIYYNSNNEYFEYIEGILSYDDSVEVYTCLTDDIEIYANLISPWGLTRDNQNIIKLITLN